LLLSVAKSSAPQVRSRWLNSNPPWTCSPIARQKNWSRSLHFCGARRSGVQAQISDRLAYYHKNRQSENENVISSIILGTSLLTARGIPGW